MTAICKDANNAGVSGVVVSFKTSAGVLDVTQGTTDTSGTATAVLTTGGDPANQTISLSAIAGSATSNTVSIQETGTTATISGPVAVGASATATYVVTLKDAGSNVIANQIVAMTSSLNNPITSSAKTNSSGQATFSYTGTTGGTDTLTATATSLNVSATYTVVVSENGLSFTSPANGTSILFDSATTLTVQYVGGTVSGQTVSFAATRGEFVSSGTGTASAVTNNNGIASVSIEGTAALGAGPSIVTATVGGATATLNLTFVATTPASVVLQASPSTVALNGTSTITATVLDAYQNPVANQTVDFFDADHVSGQLSPASFPTNGNGVATVTFTASSTPSAQKGVVISASVEKTSVSSNSAQDAYLTVTGAAVNITLGTGNSISDYSDTAYELPYDVQVQDSAGNPISNAVVNLSIQATAFQMGHMVYGTVWAPSAASEVQSSDPYWNGNSVFDYQTGGTWFTASTYPLVTAVPFGCVTEDPGDTFKLVAGGTAYDYSGDGVLEPGSPATLPATVTLDAYGSAQFEIVYPKNYALWTQVVITATTTVAGTSGTAYATFPLAGLAGDYGNSGVAPPGQTSPFGDSSVSNSRGAITSSSQCIKATSK